MHLWGHTGVPSAPAWEGGTDVSWPSGLGGQTSPHPFCSQFLDMVAAVVVQLLSLVRLFATPWNCSLPGSSVLRYLWSLLRFMSVESVMLF